MDNQSGQTVARVPSTPVVGAARGAVVGTIAATVTTLVLTAVPSPYSEAVAVMAGAVTTGVLNGIGKWARDRGDLWAALLGWLI